MQRELLTFNCFQLLARNDNFWLQGVPAGLLTRNVPLTLQTEPFVVHHHKHLASWLVF